MFDCGFEQLEPRVLLSAGPSDFVPNAGSHDSPTPDIVVEATPISGNTGTSLADPFQGMEPQPLFPAQMGGDSTSLHAAAAPPVVWTGDIPNGTVWQPDVVQEVKGTATVAFGSTLTIQPGAIIKFDSNARLTIFGTLQAQGSADSHIIFTSLKDDSAGGDTNGDGPRRFQPLVIGGGYQSIQPA